MKKVENIIEMGICCLIPIYQANIGNATKLITENGQSFIDKRTTKTVLKIIAKYYTIHIEACREKYGKIIHQRLNVPICLHDKLLLVPFKMRKPKFTKDGALGYINLYDIEELKEKDNNTMIKLKSGVIIKLLNKIKTVQKHINEAKVVAGERLSYSRRNMGYEVQEFFKEYNSPATRGDVLNLQKEILELRDALKKALVPLKEKDI